jgi:hypothetical protein
MDPIFGSLVVGVLCACWGEIRTERYFAAQWRKNADAAVEVAQDAAARYANLAERFKTYAMR